MDGLLLLLLALPAAGLDLPDAAADSCGELGPVCGPCGIGTGTLEGAPDAALALAAGVVHAALALVYDPSGAPALLGALPACTA